MANVYDVAQYILHKHGSMTTMKLQKLVYYCQAWSTVWDGRALFDEEIQAWASGPVVPDLYKLHRGFYQITSLTKGDESNLDTTQLDTINAVLNTYGEKSAQWLSDLTHMEDPWKKARDGISDGQNCENVISLASLEEYYGSL
jgi:uncharacterized phage-associated protein